MLTNATFLQNRFDSIIQYIVVIIVYNYIIKIFLNFGRLVDGSANGGSYRRLWMFTTLEVPNKGYRWRGEVG